MKPHVLSQHADGGSQAELTGQSLHRVESAFLKQSQTHLNFDNLIKTQVVNKGEDLAPSKSDMAVTKELNRQQ